MNGSFPSGGSASATPSEEFVQAFHARDPGCTARAFARGGSYARLAARVPHGARVLDLACGDGALLAHLGPAACGVDLSEAELARAGRIVSPPPACAVGSRIARARADALPFAPGAFDVVTCHLAFMLFDRADAIAAELARVLAPGGTFLAVLGGGPTADGDDAFHRFLALLAAQGPRPIPALGDPRARTEAGWRALFPGWSLAPFERWPLELGSTFDDVWAFLGASYEVPPARAAALRADLRAATAEWGDRVPCTAVVFLGSATRT